MTMVRGSHRMLHVNITQQNEWLQTYAAARRDMGRQSFLISRSRRRGLCVNRSISMCITSTHKSSHFARGCEVIVAFDFSGATAMLVQFSG